MSTVIVLIAVFVWFVVVLFCGMFIKFGIQGSENENVLDF